ncbi:MAG TPA: TonB-dependent receptor, partial [Hellea balneolensis]|nr:TonB-dependent receptor [Hellea balneolensis]
YSNVHFAENFKNEIHATRAQNALLATTDANGNPICRPDLVTDPNCVPINWFQVGGVTQAALNYVSGTGFQDGNVTQVIGLATVSGDLGQYGFKMPGMDEGAKIVVGVEYREDDYELRTDDNFTNNLLAGQGGPTIGLAGSYDSWEGFGELEFPLLADQPFAEELTFKGAYRYADNELGGGASSYSAGGIWQINDYIRARGQYQRAVRFANAVELFRATSVGLFNLAGDDPCANGTGPNGVGIRATAAQCALSGVTAAQYGNIVANPANQYNALFGGNTALKPEKSDTFTIGAVARLPGMLDGMTLSLDYFDIQVDGFIGTVPPNQALDRCILKGDTTFCNLINRDPASGSLWLVPTGFVKATNVNTGSLSTSGVDLAVNYAADLPGSWGGLDASFQGTYLIDSLTQSLPGDTPFECVGFYAGQCGNPTPSWRHIASATWKTTHNLDAKLTWRHFADVKISPDVGAAAGSKDEFLGAADFFDVAFTYRGIEGVTLRAGVNNVLDSEPPISTSTGAGNGNGNTFPQIYDALGRYLFARATIDF